MKYFVIAGVCLILYKIVNIIEWIMWDVEKEKGLDDALAPIDEKWLERRYK